MSRACRAAGRPGRSVEPARAFGRSSAPQVIDEGMKRSRTFREIVSQIDQMPGFVYIVGSRCGAYSSGFETEAALAMQAPVLRKLTRGISHAVGASSG
jgi:hypothetical protein